jgi:preprotein translocase subunit YajC
MLAAFILFAQDAVPDPAKDAGGPPPMANIFIIMVLVAAFFLIVVLPAQRKERKQRESLFANLKKNDEVLTSSGIIGVVQNLRPEDDEVTIKIDENCKVRMKKSSIVQILKAKDEAPAAK